MAVELSEAKGSVKEAALELGIAPRVGSVSGRISTIVRVTAAYLPFL